MKQIYPLTLERWSFGTGSKSIADVAARQLALIRAAILASAQRTNAAQQFFRG
jgi:hypothetical protein